MSAMTEGRIIKALSGFYYVYTEQRTVECRARGRLRLDGRIPLVGDLVTVSEQDGKGTLHSILPRSSEFVRPPVANVELMIVVASGVIPVSDPYVIDRMCAVALAAGCRPVICINKIDRDPAEKLWQIYGNAGFPVVRVSAVTGEGIEELSGLTAGKLCAFAGNSGVGKSSILNRLDPSLELPTGEVSSKLGRGRHTTRHVELFPMSNGAWIADTPGFSSFDVEEMAPVPKEELPYVFPEFSECLGSCRFDDCTHTRETGCAVRAAVEEGRISPERYHSYVRMYEQVKDVKAWQDRRYVKFSDKKKSDGESP